MRARTGLLAAAVLALAAPGPALAATHVVHRGESIQAAVNDAHKGDTIQVLPGTYRSKGYRCPTEKGRCAVVVRKDGIRLVAKPRKGHPVVLAARKGQEQGIAIARSANGPRCLKRKKLRVQGSLVQGFTVRGFAGDGVFLFCVDKWRVTRVHANGNREYGIFPSHVGKGKVDHSFASGANDTGIYIGQSHNVRITHNHAHNNVSGFEIENSTHVLADGNTATGNTAGLLSFALPGLDVKVNRHNIVEKNQFDANNRKNTCLDPGDEVCNVPAGSGVILVAADTNLVRSNEVRNNNTLGIGVASYCILIGGSNPNCTKDIDPSPNDDHILTNVALGNGKAPDPRYAAFASDLAWDTTGSGNCWGGNTFKRSFPDNLPPCPVK